ncbi:MAG TPA: transporter substrate-binding domain-containing protein [Planctomycetota bacterium]|nr:transporter substrate-binding domain-containing protein [Planctomycetota bacterium]
MKVDSILLSAVVLAVALLSGCGKEQSSTPPKPDNAPAHGGTARSGDTLGRIQAAKVLRIGIKGDAPPFCFQDKEGNPQGFDVDIGFRLARALGVEPLFVTVTGPDRIPRLKKGDVDVVIATLTATRSRAKEIDFSLPYYQDQQGLLVKAATPIQSYRDLAGKKVAAVAQSTSIANIKIVAPDAQIVEVQSLGEAFEKLNNGAADAVTGDGLQLRAMRLAAPDQEQFRIAGEGFSAEPYVIGLPQNDSQFRAKVDEFLTELWNSGAWTRIFNKWLGSQSAYNLEAQFQMPVLPP